MASPLSQRSRLYLPASAVIAFRMVCGTNRRIRTLPYLDKVISYAAYYQYSQAIAIFRRSLYIFCVNNDVYMKRIRDNHTLRPAVFIGMTVFMFVFLGALYF